MKRYEESKSCFTQALPIYPQVPEYALCLGDLGGLHKEMKQYEQSEYYMLQACQIFEANFPGTINQANSLRNLGLLYEMAGKEGEAREKLQAARELFVKIGDEKMVKRCYIAIERIEKNCVLS
jgi:tetratricopeptide (TPR) repeat protein